LKNHIRQTFEHQVPDQGRKVYIEIIPEVLELLRIADGLQAGILLQKCLECLVPRKFLDVRHIRVPLIFFIVALTRFKVDMESPPSSGYKKPLAVSPLTTAGVCIKGITSF
jgi:hypothetical protein